MDRSSPREDLWKDPRNLEDHEMDLSLPREDLWKDPRNLEDHEMDLSLSREDHEMDLTNLEGLLIEGFLEMVNWIEVQIWIRPQMRRRRHHRP
jgi:hypothetical protein